MAGEITFGLRFRNKRFKSAAAGLAALGKSIGKNMDTLGVVLSDELDGFVKTELATFSKKHGTAYPNGTTTKTLSRRSGGLQEALSTAGKVTKSNKFHQIKAEFRLPSKYAVHEKGAVITPKKSKYLTVPLPNALHKNGTPKRHNARAWPDTFVIKSKKGNLLIVQSRNGEIYPLYVLLKSVTLPPRLGMEDHFKKAMPRFIDNAVTKAYDHLMEQ